MNQAVFTEKQKGNQFFTMDNFMPRLHGTGPTLGPDRPCVDTGPPGTGTMWAHLRKAPSTDLDRSRSRVNGQDRSHFGSVSLFMLSNRNVHAVATLYSSLISA